MISMVSLAPRGACLAFRHGQGTTGIGVSAAMHRTIDLIKPSKGASKGDAGQIGRI
jgi:hypothetical protein